MKIQISGKQFAKRVTAYNQAATAAAKGWFDAEGNWLTTNKPLETRERFWLACALYHSGANALADAVIRQGETALYGNVRFNIFDTNIAVALLVRYRDRMAPDVRAKLEDLARDGFSFKPGNRQPDYQFHGYNDNMPAKATMGLILGGELLAEPAAVEYGLWNLRQLRAMLVRCGINSEYNSPTYSALTIHAMGEIAEHAKSLEARKLALGIEQRLWLDAAARFHPELGVISGPNSRAYTVDTIAQLSIMSSTLWFVLGDGVRPSPMELFRQPVELTVHHMGDVPFNIAQMCWFAAGSYHVPAAAKRMFRTRKYPFHAVATCEQGDAGPDFPARPARIETYLARDFTLGTATTPLCGGEQTMSYFVTYKRRDPVASYRDVGTVFTKTVLDDDLPGTIARPQYRAPAGEEFRKLPPPAVPPQYSNSGEADHLHSYANTITLQAESTALVLTHPHLALGGPADSAGIIQTAKPRAIRRLSELVIFPAHFGTIDEVIVGGQPRADWSGTVKQGEWIACRSGKLLIAIRPMAYSRTLGPATIALEKANAYQFIRFTYYQGEARTFTRGELRHVFGGFLAEHASVEDYPSLAAFTAEVGQTRFTDYFWTTRRVRCRRPAGTVLPALELEVSWSPGSYIPRIAAINGRAVEWPAVKIDGLKAKNFPFLGEPFESVPAFFPWQDFRVEWGDWPYAVNDRES